MSKLRKVIYLVEGDNEKIVVDAIKTKYIITGKVIKFNCLEKNASNLVRTMTQTVCVIVIDSDVLDKAKIRCLNSNVRKLKAKKMSVVLITQNKNLEDELVKTLDIANILEMYGVENLDKHKVRLNKERDMLRKLESLGFRFSDFGIQRTWISKALTLENHQYSNNLIA